MGEPNTFNAIEYIKTHDLSTARIADGFMSRREFHAIILPDLPISETIQDLAWDIINSGYQLEIEDAIMVVHQGIAHLGLDLEGGE